MTGAAREQYADGLAVARVRLTSRSSRHRSPRVAAAATPGPDAAQAQSPGGLGCGTARAHWAH